MRSALTRVPDIPSGTRRALSELGTTLGRFDLAGQLKGLETVRGECRRELEQMNVNKDVRLRSYQTLGFCAGAAVAILLI